MCHIIQMFLFFGGVLALKDLKLMVPGTVRSGDAVWLTCDYDLQGKLLYTVKWYLNDAEFYRYSPKRNPPGLALSVKDIKVNLTRSNMNDVMLLDVSRNQTGIYKCEATEEFPTLETRTQQSYMMVVEVPEQDPSILVQRDRLPVGETLRANCTSGSSLPAPIITWTINGEPLDNNKMEFRINFRNIPMYAEKFMTRSSLEIKIVPKLFQDSKIRLRCFANIHPVYQATAELEITEDVPFIASITGNASPRNYQTNVCSRNNLSVCLNLATTVFLVLVAVTVTNVR
ncbi:uncharacterized protein LOC122510743 isoform X2 [Leptopilina heterotoma]|uniref:uncharacterized protein LOC122510743 isoform X2 n=1 Tax=Leptopilina heterotoma TaxID=63436 RepID=UPI001CA9090B|nr:uncharacterized protein LOC122510743 isoform X2 [Leptopilina heterotoma]XP_043481543.1 uncharacterized protein LOC122510743 isoform X2 [Leptopilina heterotoma]